MIDLLLAIYLVGVLVVALIVVPLGWSPPVLFVDDVLFGLALMALWPLLFGLALGYFVLFAIGAWEGCIGRRLP